MKVIKEVLASKPNVNVTPAKKPRNINDKQKPGKNASVSRVPMEPVQQEPILTVTVVDDDIPENNLKECALTSDLDNSCTSRSGMVVTENSVSWPTDGILRQALMAFSYTPQDEKTLKEVSDTKLERDDKQMDAVPTTVSESPPARILTSPKPTTLVTGDLENLSLVPLPCGSFTTGVLPLMGPLPPVSEIPRPGSIPPLGRSTPTPAATCCSVSLKTTSFTNNTTSISMLSEALATPVSSVGPSLKVLLPLSQPSSSTQIITQASASPISIAMTGKEAPVTLVYSSIPKLESASTHIASSVCMVNTPLVSHMATNIINNASKTKVSLPSEKPNNVHKSVSSGISVTDSSQTDSESVKSQFTSPEIIPLISPSSVSVCAQPLKLDNRRGSSTNVNRTSAPQPRRETVSLKFESAASSLDVGGSILIPVSSSLGAGKQRNTTRAHNDTGLTAASLTSVYGHLPVTSLPFTIPLSVTTNHSTISTSAVQMFTQSIISTVAGTAETSLASIGQDPRVLLRSDPLPVADRESSSPKLVTSPTGGNSVSTSGSDSVPATSIIPTTCSTNLFTSPTVSMEPVSYPMQSPAEILSQLSKAGVLPAMSSSQVSSVLSALASDNGVPCHMDLDTDSAHHAEMLTHPVVQLPHVPDKVSTLTQTDSLSVELDCAVVTRDEGQENKLISVRDSPDDAMIVHQVMNILPTTHSELEKKNGASPNKTSTAVNTDTTLIHQASDNVQTPDIIPIHIPSAVPKQPPSNYAKVIQKRPIPSLKRKSIHETAKLLAESVSKRCGEVKSERLLPVVFIKQEEAANCPTIQTQYVCSSSSKPKPTNESKGRKKKRTVPVQLAGANGGREDSFTVSKNSKLQKKPRLADIDKDEQSNSSFVEQVACYKCTFCPLLSLDKSAVSSHVRTVHSSNLNNGACDGKRRLKCPGCPNTFLVVNSLRVHLTQDHQVGENELRTIVAAVIKKSLETTPHKDVAKKKKLVGKQVCSEGFNVYLDGEDQRSNTSSEGFPDEGSKIRVRNLDSRRLASEEGQSSGLSDEEGREGSLVIDDEPSTHKKATDTNGYTLIRPEGSLNVSSSLSDSDSASMNVVTTTGPLPPRKRGRPRGSRSLQGSTTKKQFSVVEKLEEGLGYRCDVDRCAVRMRSHDNIQYHRRCHKGESFSCPECSHESSSWNVLSNHLWRGHVIDMELYACEQCSYKTSSFAKLTNVHQRIHGEERPFPCDVCGKGFKNLKQMRNHKVIHNVKQKQKTSKIGECDVCGRSFSNPRMLRLHKDNVHDKLRPYLCNYCGYSASSRSTLKMHMRQHTGEKPFQCEECEYRTADHNSLRRHRMRHTGAKPYKCPHCLYACIQSSTYKAHLKSKHPGLESGFMFSCGLCSFRSVKKENYLAHVAHHEAGSIPTRVRTLGSQPDGTGATEDKEDGRLPVIINISQSLVSDHASSDGIFSVQMQPDTVIELVEEMDAEGRRDQNLAAEGRSMDSVTEMPLTPDFEAEEITGDIREPQELKFKVSEELPS